MGVYKRGTTWYIDYYAGYKRRREKIGPSKRQAEVVLKKRMVQVAENRFLEVEKYEKIKFENMGIRLTEVASACSIYGYGGLPTNIC